MKKKTKLITGSIIASLTLASLGAIAITQINAKAEEERLYALYDKNIGSLCSSWAAGIENIEKKDFSTALENYQKTMNASEELIEYHFYFQLINDSNYLTIEQLQDWETNGFTEENEGEEVYNLVLEGQHTFYDDAYFYLCSPEALVNGIEIEEDPSVFPFFWEDWVYIDELNGDTYWDPSVG